MNTSAFGIQPLALSFLPSILDQAFKGGLKRAALLPARSIFTVRASVCRT